MRTALNALAVIALLVGALWVLQGANIVGGSVMSGQSMWLYIGMAIIVAAAVALWWINRRR